MTSNGFILIHPLRMRRRLAEAKNRRSQHNCPRSPTRFRAKQTCRSTLSRRPELLFPLSWERFQQVMEFESGRLRPAQDRFDDAGSQQSEAQNAAKVDLVYVLGLCEVTNGRMFARL